MGRWGIQRHWLPYTGSVHHPAQLLLAWFSTHQRPHPWRGPFPRDPYRVLLSEIMLQQTQVQRAVPFYHRFLELFPNLPSLASAPEQEVLAAWSGLGYYRRARALHAAARTIAAAGGWPTSYQHLKNLPGLGPYTAAAVAAFCFHGNQPPVDGNVARVAARVGDLTAPAGTAQLVREAEQWVRTLHGALPRPEVFEAIIELGATLCRPTAPACQHCPLATGCSAFATGAPNRLPTPRPPRARQKLVWVALWLERSDGRVLLQQRSEVEPLSGLWLPPLLSLEDGTPPAAAAAQLMQHLACPAPLRPAAPVRHTITYRDITVFPFVASVEGFGVRENLPWAWVDPHSPGLPTSSLTEKLRHACQKKGQDQSALRPGDPPAGVP